MLNVRRVRAFDDNYIWLIGTDDDRHVTIVDPGDEIPVFEALERDGLTPEAILITHHHHDHTGGIPDLVARYRLPVYGPEDPRISGLDHIVGDADVVTLPESGLQFKVLATPGHTNTHICYVGHGALFCGDTLFVAGCGRLFEGTPQQMHHSLEKLRALPDETVVYCAHEYTEANLQFAHTAEPDNRAVQQRRDDVIACRRRNEATVPSLMGEEKQTNPFLRYDDPVLIAAAADFAGRPVTPGADAFAVVRHWKDTLD